MLSLGAVGFLQPFFLAGLLALPLLWWLLRATPPAAKRVAFPGVTVLLGLADRERTPQRTPWWLLLLRLLAAAALLLAFSEPLLNPKARTAGDGPVLVILDGGWPSAPDWSARRAAAEAALGRADEAGRPAALAVLASPGPAPEALSFTAASDAVERVAALEPAPWRPDPSRLITAVAASDHFDTVWIHDGLVEDDPAGGSATAALADALGGRGTLTLIGPETIAKALGRPEIRDRALIAPVLRATPGAEETVRVSAFGGGAESGARRVGASEAVFDGEALRAEASVDLPVELRNTLERLQIDGARHAGSVALLDDRFRRRTVALISGEQERRGLPLLSSLHYLRAALKPHAEARETTLRAALGLPEDVVGGAAFGDPAAATPLAGWADAVVLADIGRIDPETETALTEWVRSGGLLIRFAGPKLAALAIERRRPGGRDRPDLGADGDPLLPVRLRGGGRALGGALSWSEPQGLAAFDPDGPFGGLAIPPEVKVARQVLAQPTPTLSDRVVASLADGTPLVTAKPLGEGRVVLFHTTASAAWSSLPLSGLFVDMMGRLVAEAPALTGAFGGVGAGADVDPQLAGDGSAPDGSTAEALTAAAPTSEATAAVDAALWRPVAVLDGFGALVAADDAAPPTPGALLAQAVEGGARPGAPPGLYEPLDPEAFIGGDDARPAQIAVNALGGGARLVPYADPPASARVQSLSEREETAMKPALLAAALTLLIVDIIAALAVAGRLKPTAAARGGGAAAAALAAVLTLTATGAGPGTARAQAADVAAAAADGRDIVDPAERRAGLESVMGFVITGDARVDRISEAGLVGLQRTLTERTAIEPGAPAGVDLEGDELALYAILYWPVTPSQPTPSAAALRRLNAFMQTGGLLIVDTRDAHRTFGSGDGPNAGHLRRLLGDLDLPPIEPLDPDHVLTRTYYLIDGAPGRWRGGQVWVKAGAGDGGVAGDGFDRAAGDVNDGVSPIVIGAADWAGAWAVDNRGRPLFPISRGGERQREAAKRFGVNLAMYAYTGNYKSDQVHIDVLLDRLDN